MSADSHGGTQCSEMRTRHAMQDHVGIFFSTYFSCKVSLIGSFLGVAPLTHPSEVGKSD